MKSNSTPPPWKRKHVPGTVPRRGMYAAKTKDIRRQESASIARSHPPVLEMLEGMNEPFGWRYCTINIQTTFHSPNDFVIQIGSRLSSLRHQTVCAWVLHSPAMWRATDIGVPQVLSRLLHVHYRVAAQVSNSGQEQRWAEQRCPLLSREATEAAVRSSTHAGPSPSTTLISSKVAKDRVL